MKYPGEVYTPSAKAYRPPNPPEYPFHDRTILVTQCGRICIGRRKINLSQVFGGQHVGIREVADRIWLVLPVHLFRHVLFLDFGLYDTFRAGDLWSRLHDRIYDRT